MIILFKPAIPFVKLIQIEWSKLITQYGVVVFLLVINLTDKSQWAPSSQLMHNNNHNHRSVREACRS